MALIFELKVIPSSGCFKFIRSKNGELKCYLKAVPEGGQANQELIKGLAKLLGLTQRDVEIVSGVTSRKKRIKIHALLTLPELCAALQVACQEAFVSFLSDDSCSIE